MGLDMYLEKDIYIGANYKHREVDGKIEITQNGKPIRIDLSKVTTITESAGYWRKANAIHNWFVHNVQDGVDDCKRYDVSFEKLTELKELCEKVLETKNAELLPPVDGFFFGSTDVDAGYFSDLVDTIEIIKNLTDDGDYYYQSSW